MFLMDSSSSAIEDIFQTVVSSDWLLCSGSIFFLLAGILFANLFILHDDTDETKKIKEAAKEKIKKALENDQKQEEQQPQQQTKDSNSKAAASSSSPASQQQQPISLQLVVNNNHNSDTKNSGCQKHPFTSQIPLGPQIENLCATHTHPSRFMRSLGCELKMVIVMRRDLKPTESLAASWGSTVASEEVQHIRSSFQEPWLSWLKTWNAMAVAKVAVRADSVDIMYDVIRCAVDVEAKKRELNDRHEKKKKQKQIEDDGGKGENSKKEENSNDNNNNTNNDNNDDDAQQQKQPTTTTTSKNKDEDDKTARSKQKAQEEEEEKQHLDLLKKICSFPLPLTGLVMTNKKSSKQTDDNSSKKSDGSSKKKAPAPKNTKKPAPLDVTTKDFRVLSSKALLAAISVAINDDADEDDDLVIPCVAIGPCPVSHFVGVTDTLKLY